MVSIKDFTPGQNAYILHETWSSGKRQDIIRCVVIAVGRKYVKVGTDLNDRFPREYHNLRGDDDYLTIKDGWRGGYKLFPTQEQAFGEIEREKLIQDIRNHINQIYDCLTLKQLQDIHRIMSEAGKRGE